MIICKETEKEVYSLSFPLTGYGDAENLKGDNAMKTLCRIRLHKCKEHESDPETLVIVKIPFTKYSLIW